MGIKDKRAERLAQKQVAPPPAPIVGEEENTQNPNIRPEYNEGIGQYLGSGAGSLAHVGHDLLNLFGLGPKGDAQVYEEGDTSKLSNLTSDTLLGAGQGASFNLMDDLAAVATTGASYLNDKHNDKSLSDRFSAESERMDEVFANSKERSPVASVIGEVGGALAGLPAKAGSTLFNLMRPSGFLKTSGTMAAVGAGEAGLMSFNEGNRGTELIDPVATGGLGALALYAPFKAAGVTLGALAGTRTAGKLKDLFSRDTMRGLLPEELKAAKTGAYIDEAPQTAELAGDVVAKTDLTQPTERAKFLELHDATKADIGATTQRIEEVAESVRPSVSAGKREIQLDTELTDAKAGYDGFVAAAGDNTVDSGELTRAFNYAFMPKGEKTILSEQANKVRTKWVDQIAQVKARSPNGQIPVKTLLDFRKDIASLINSDNAAELGSAYPKLTRATKDIDTLIDDASGGLYKPANAAYSKAYSSKEAYDIGGKMYGDKFDADSALFWLDQNPQHAGDFKDGMRNAITNKMDKGITSGLRNLFGDPTDPLKINKKNFAKLEKIIGASEAKALRDVYQKLGPRRDALGIFNNALNQKAMNPSVAMTSLAPERAATAHAVATGGPLAVGQSIGTARSAHKVLNPSVNGEQPLSQNMSGSVLDFMNAQGQGYKDKAAQIMGTPNFTDASRTAPVASGAIMDDYSIGDGILGTMNATKAAKDWYTDKER